MNEEQNEKTLTGKERSRLNLKPFKSYNESTEEERERMKEIVSKGGKKAQEVNRKNRLLKDVYNDVYKIKVNREKAKSYVGDDIDLLVFDDDGLVELQEVLAIRATRLATDGNIKAYEFARDTAGQAPTKTFELDGNLTMTEADRALLANVNERLNKNK